MITNLIPAVHGASFHLKPDSIDMTTQSSSKSSPFPLGSKRPHLYSYTHNYKPLCSFSGAYQEKHATSTPRVRVSQISIFEK